MIFKISSVIIEIRRIRKLDEIHRLAFRSGNGIFTVGHGNCCKYIYMYVHMYLNILD